MIKINAPKGTKDCLPGEVRRWQYLSTAFEETARRFGFTEVRTPMIEYTELFARGIGDTTDVVEKQMYTFEDYGGRSITLRPEGTAGVARAFLENKLYAEPLPAKLWYEIPCFRYEKPQKGRLREFHQFGIEIFGSSDMLADAEVIAFGDAFLRGLGLSDAVLKINSIGCRECRPVYRKRITDYFDEHLDELCDTCKGRLKRNPMRVFDCKSPVCQGIAAEAPVMLESLCGECEADFAALQSYLDAMGVKYEIDAFIVRGLDYYTKTAFEFVSGRIGAQSAVCGGGRYDHLLEELGGEDIPGVGFGLGIERLIMALEDTGLPEPAVSVPDALIVYIGEEAKARALALLNELRAAGAAAELDVCARNTKGQFKYADKTGARFAVIIGDEELESGKATIKDMVSGNQTKVSFSEVAGAII